PAHPETVSYTGRDSPALPGAVRQRPGRAGRATRAMALNFLLLYLLATCDAAFCGYRAPAGRNALLFKRNHYLRAMASGALRGQLAVALAGLAASVLVIASASPWRVLDDFARASSCLLQIYLPYAAIIALAFMMRTLPSVDVRSMTSVLVFG